MSPNRVIAFLGPYIALASGFAATWLGSHVTFLHIFVNHDATANQVAKVVTFLAGVAVTWALHHKWLTGWQKFEFLSGYGVQSGVPELSGHGAAPGDLSNPASSPVVLPPDVNELGDPETPRGSQKQ